jgi:hypothetical protein
LYSLVDDNTDHKDHVACVEFDVLNKQWSVVYIERPLSNLELEGILNLISKLQ